MVKRPQISVVVPLYGTFNLARALVSINSLLSQRDIDYEVIVSEQGEKPIFPDFKGVRHLFKYHKPMSNLSDFNPGNVRNIGIALAQGELVYTNDADIVFMDPNYLSKATKLVESNKDLILYRPLMRRLPLDEFEDFDNRVKTQGILRAIKHLDLYQEYIATLYHKQRKVRVFKKNSVYLKTFTAFEDDFQKYVSDESNKGKEPMFWNENRHCGGNLFRKSHFLNVGGYHEGFINWGCEDSDLQWKFHESYCLRFFPEEFEVLHLDHPKGYFSPEIWAQNEKISGERKIRGLDNAIKEDRRNQLWTP